MSNWFFMMDLSFLIFYFRKSVLNKITENPLN